MTDRSPVSLLTPLPAQAEQERMRVVVTERDVWLTRRRALLMEVAAIEAFLGMEKKSKDMRESGKIEPTK